MGTWLEIDRLWNSNRLLFAVLVLDEIGVVIWGIGRLCLIELNLFASRTACLQPSASFLVEVQFWRLREGVFILYLNNAPTVAVVFKIFVHL